MNRCYPLWPDNGWAVPSTDDRAISYAQQINWILYQLNQLTAAVANLDERVKKLEESLDKSDNT